MDNNFTKPLLSRYLIFSLFLLCCLSLSEKAFSYEVKKWNRSYFSTTYNVSDNSIELYFEFFDYNFGSWGENGYLTVCDFLYSTDGVNYKHFMRAETPDQKKANWSWLRMRYKLAGAQIRFDNCYSPEPGTMWPENQGDVRIEVHNILNYPNLAKFQVKWFVRSTYKNVKFIKLTGVWHCNGFAAYNRKIDEVYELPAHQPMLTHKSNDLNDSASLLKATVSENKAVKVFTEADAVVVKGADHGERIKIYTISGAQIKSIISNSDVVKVKLPSNQAYIVNIGAVSYKVNL